MKRIYSTPVCKTAAMTCDNILIESLHTGDSNTGGTGGGRQGANSAFFEEEEEYAPLPTINVWDED